MCRIFFALLVGMHVCTTAAILPSNPKGPSLVMAFIVRDEEVNLRSNLPAYVPLVDYYVFMVDRRTSDGTLKAIEEILGGKRHYHVEIYDFDGFGPARTASLKMAWKHFSNATHVWIADPDWKADEKTIVMSELSMDVDAFRFLIYDRNGFTTRRCDWLIRNRPTNAMRYNLHEVLDIGETYTWKEISWVVHEIEQKGSWHNKVGHASSHASKRYIFDLMYLEKDLIEYAHDAHTDYYLGVTHHAYVDALNKEAIGPIDVSVVQPSGRSIAEHMKLSIKYLTLRATYNYEREFIEERWGVMFLLGTIHGFMSNAYDLAESEKWFSMCRDYNPSQMECSINLINVYMNAGLYDKMMNELSTLIKTPYIERTMMNHYTLKGCGVPGLAVSVLSISDEVQKSSQAYNPAAVKFLHALALSLDTDMCRSHDPSLFERSMQQVANVMSKNGEFFRRGYASLGSLCADTELQDYLSTNSILQHPCENFFKKQQSIQYCAEFGVNLAPPYDALQIAQHDDFIGAANVFDIVHHAYGGDAGRVFANKKNVYRVLFAQYFNPKNVYTLLKQLMDQKDGKKVEIYILPGKDSIKADIEQHIKFCLGNHAPFKTRSSMKNHGIDFLDSIDQAKHKFDYIEYNSGMSRSATYKDDLQLLISFLADDGVIGITAFSQNKYAKEILRLVKNRDKYAHLPFSGEPFRLARDYLSTVGLKIRSKKDADLSWFLSSNTSERLYTKDKLTADIENSGLSIVSFVPSALSSPYDELPRQAVIQKWKSFGLPESDFVEEFVAPFRYTVYASKQGASLPGRPDLLNDEFSVDTVIVDRSGGALAEVFRGLQGQPGAFEALRVPLYVQVKLNPDLKSMTAADEDKTVSLYLSPDCVAGLSLLPTSPSIHEMIKHNIALRPKSLQFEESIPSLLLRNLVDLENLNMLSVWKPYGVPGRTEVSPASVAPSEILQRDASALVREHESKRDEKMKAMKAMGFAQSVIDIALDADEKEFRASLGNIEAQTVPSPPVSSTNTRGIKEKIKKPKPVSAAAVPAMAGTGSLAPAASPVGGGTVIKNSDGSAVYLGGGVTVGVTGADGKLMMMTGGVMPILDRQTKEQLAASFRQKNCQGKEGSPSCLQNAMQIRFTSDMAVTTLSKLEFDLRQLRFIAFEYPASAGIIQEYLIFAYQQLKDAVKERAERLGHSRTDLMTLTDAEIAISRGYINSVIHLTKEPALKEGAFVCHEGALSKMSELAEGLLSNDFVVMDSLLENRPLRILSQMLLGSTVWFDAGNGEAFMSHSNDGLVFNMASQLADEISVSFGSNFVVKKYVAIAMDLSKAGKSPVFYGLTNEYYAVLWLNSFAAHTAEDRDGILVFGDGAGACLQSHGGSVDSKIHRDFVTVYNSLDVDIEVLCNDFVASELIPRKHNRLTLVAPNRAFVLLSPGGDSKKSFDTNTALAVVFSLSSQKKTLVG